MGKIGPVAELTAVSVTSALTPQERTEQNKLIQAVEKLNDSRLFGQGNELTFHLDRRSKRLVFRIVDKETQEVVRQIPAEYLLRLADELSK